MWMVQRRARIECVPFPTSKKAAASHFLVSARSLRVPSEEAFLLPLWPLVIVRDRQHELADYLLVLPCRSLIDRLVQII